MENLKRLFSQLDQKGVFGRIAFWSGIGLVCCFCANFLYHIYVAYRLSWIIFIVVAGWHYITIAIVIIILSLISIVLLLIHILKTDTKPLLRHLSIIIPISTIILIFVEVLFASQISYMSNLLNLSDDSLLNLCEAKSVTKSVCQYWITHSFSPHNSRDSNSQAFFYNRTYYEMNRFINFAVMLGVLLILFVSSIVQIGGIHK